MSRLPDQLVDATEKFAEFDFLGAAVDLRVVSSDAEGLADLVSEFNASLGDSLTRLSIATEQAAEALDEGSISKASDYMADAFETAMDLTDETDFSRYYC